MSDETPKCDYCQRYPVRYVVHSDAEIRMACGRHLAVTADLLLLGASDLTVDAFVSGDNQP